MNSSQRETAPDATWGPWFAGLVFAAYAAILLAHRAPPSLTDYADWTYEGVLLRNHILGHPDPTHLLKHYPVPNSAATIGIGLLALVLPWTLAAKAWLIVQFTLTFAALRHIAHTLRVRTLFWLVLPQAVFLNLNFWYGLVNFQLGLCWILFLISILLRRQDSSGRDWPVGLVLLLAFFTHMLSFAFCCLLILLYCRQIRSWKLLWQLIPGALLSAWYLFGRFFWAGNADGHVGIGAVARDYSLAFWIFKLNTLPRFLGFVNPGAAGPQLLGRPLYLVLFGLNLVLAIVLTVMLYRCARRVWRQGIPENFIFNAALVMLPCFLLVPGAAFGVYDPGGRLLQMALVAGLPLCTSGFAPNSIWLARLAGFSSVALTAAGLYLFAITGFQPNYLPAAPRLPHLIADFALVPNSDQDAYYRALEHGYESWPVFPTGMFLNQRPAHAPGTPFTAAPSR